MRLPVVDNLKSEIFVPVTPEMVWTQPSKELKDMTIAYVTGAGVHQKDQERYNLAGDFTWRKIDNNLSAKDLMVTHGGYDNSDANKDINAMFPIDRMHEIAEEGFIGACAPYHIGFMGGGGDIQKFREVAGPAIAQFLKEEGVDGVVMTAGWGTCHRSTVLVQREIEKAGIPTIIVAALPPVARQTGTPRASAPRVPMGANAGAPNNPAQQTEILKETLKLLVSIDSPGKIVPLAIEYNAQV